MLLPLSLGVPLAIISIVGLCLNGYIFLVLVSTKQVSPNNILLMHLSITQTLLSLLFLVFSFPPIVHQGSWVASIEILCILQGFLFTLLNPLSLWTICGLNCDRFYAIAAPLHYSAIVTTRKVIIGLVSGWIVIILLSIPPFFKVAPFKFSTNFGACMPSFLSFNSLWYAIIFTLITLLLPGIVIVGCNIKVLMIARYHRHRIAAAIYEVTLSAQVTITHQRNPFFVPTVTAPSAGGPKFRSRSPISTVLQLVGSFIILYLPYYVTIMWDSVVTILYGDNVPEKFKTNPYVVIASAVLLTCSTTINGILYGLKSKTIRKTFQNYWRKKRTKNEINQEIQARTPSTCGSRRPSISNLGFLNRPLLQRRLSETLIDIDRNSNNNQRPKMKRIASELAWRPVSLTFSGLESPTLTPEGSSSSSPATKSTINNHSQHHHSHHHHSKEHDKDRSGIDFHSRKTTLSHTASCNTLQVPSTVDNEIVSETDRELYNSVRNSFRAAKISQPVSDGNNVPKLKGVTDIRSSQSPITATTSHDNLLRRSPLLSSMNASRFLHSFYSSNSNSSSSISPKSTFGGTANYLLHKVLRLDQTDHPKRLSSNSTNTNNSSDFSNIDNCNSISNDNHNSPNSSNFFSKSKCTKRTVLKSSPLKSPRILITRAFSDESDKTPSMPGTPAKERLHRQYSSSSSNLVDHLQHYHQNHHFKLKQQQSTQVKDTKTNTDNDDTSIVIENAGHLEIEVHYPKNIDARNSEENSQNNSKEDNEKKQEISNYGEDDEDHEELEEQFYHKPYQKHQDDEREHKSKHQLHHHYGFHHNESGGSNSTTTSDISQRRYSSLEETTTSYSKEFEMDSGTEEQLLLSWPTTRKKIANKGRLYGGSSRNAIFRPSPLFNDRCEEPEVIL